MDKIDIVIIGAGVVGLAIAEKLSSVKKSILILEKNKSFGQETSSRNSEVVHGGMYYPQDSLKASLCVEGRHLLYEFCEKNKIAYKKIGKLIVAVDESELTALESIFKQGRKNGVEGLKFLTEEEIRRFEPQVRGLTAIYSRETGIVDSHHLMDCLLALARNNGVSIVYDAEVLSVRRDKDGYILSVKNNGEDVAIESLAVINCAGLDSDSVAALAGIDAVKEGYALHYCKGQYFRVALGKSQSVKRLVYPVPRPKGGGLGVHVTPDLNGSLRLGPDDFYLSNRLKDYSVDEGKRPDFYASVSRFIPSLKEDYLSPDISGIRPKLQTENGGFRDFVIHNESDKGLPGFVNLIGIESPGLTASLAIARMVKDIVLKDLQ